MRRCRIAAAMLAVCFHVAVSSTHSRSRRASDSCIVSSLLILILSTVAERVAHTSHRTNALKGGCTMALRKETYSQRNRDYAQHSVGRLKTSHAHGFKTTRITRFIEKSESLRRKYLSRAERLGKLNTWTIDLDVFKLILACPFVSYVEYRLSPMRGGLHFRWYCIRNNCKHCARIRLWLDDPGRLARDAKRPARMTNVLWDRKEGRDATQWRRILGPKK